MSCLRPRSALLLLLATAASLAACNKGTGGNAATPNSPVVAKIGDETITVAEVQEEINKQSPFIRARYTTPERKKEFLDNRVRFEVLWHEALAKGYDKDPEVVRVAKQQAITKMLQKKFEDPKWKPEGLPKADVEKYYEDHKAEFTRPEEVRASQIVVKDEAKAKKVAAEARALKKDDDKGFAALVEKNSEDASTKAMKGDLAFFDKATTRLPRPVVDAAFALKEVGDVSAPVKTDAGYHILKLTQRKAGFVRPFAEAENQIRHTLYRDVRGKEMESFVGRLRQELKVEVHEENLAKVQVDTSGNAAPGATLNPGMPGMPPGMPRPATPPAAAPAPGAHP